MNLDNVEMANADNPEEMAAATQRAFISAMRDAFRGMQKDLKQPGLTWEQLDYVLSEYAKKKPIIIQQQHEL